VMTRMANTDLEEPASLHAPRRRRIDWPDSVDFVWNTCIRRPGPARYTRR